jgi:acyl carrier protein
VAPPTVEHLAQLPPPERRPHIESLVVELFRGELLMAQDEELPLEENYFDLGLTSLTLTNVKERLEAAFGCEISSTDLFNRPTVDDLVGHLAEEVLPGLLGSPYRT